MIKQDGEEKGASMFVVLPVALIGLADAPSQATAPPQKPPAVLPAPKAGTTPTSSECSAPSTDNRTIVICTQRPQGYRLNPDVMEAKREAHGAGRPVRPGGTVIPDCATVGPQPCFSAGIPIIGAVLTAAEMAKRLAKGQEVGSMFLTDPHPSEYQLYQMAKARREAEEANRAAAQVKADAARSATVAGDSDPRGK
jgi:hypothetical protein